MKRINYINSMIRPLGDDHSMVKLIQYVGTDKMICNTARISLDGDNNVMEWHLVHRASHTIIHHSLGVGEPLFPEDMDVPDDVKTEYPDWNTATDIEGPFLPKDDFKLLKYLLKHHHGTPFEHNLITFRIVCPIFVDRQLVKHRVGVSKNEKSGRYVKMEDHPLLLKRFRVQSKSNRQASVEDTEGVIDHERAAAVWERSWQASYAAYEELLSLGVAREQARGVIPQMLYVESYYTFNLRSLFHLLGLRDHEGAQGETREFARAMYELAKPLFPMAFAARELLTLAP